MCMLFPSCTSFCMLLWLSPIAIMVTIIKRRMHRENAKTVFFYFHITVFTFNFIQPPVALQFNIASFFECNVPCSFNVHIRYFHRFCVFISVFFFFSYFSCYYHLEFSYHDVLQFSASSSSCFCILLFSLQNVPCCSMVACSYFSSSTYTILPVIHRHCLIIFIIFMNTSDAEL